MKKIKQVIVVEGRHDTEKLRKYFECDTIETHGTAIGKDVLELIKKAQAKRGVIIFTDPDSAGNRIRNIVNRAVPGCQNAFVDREVAHTTHKVGVEHAAQAPLQEALDNLITYDEHPENALTIQQLYALGITGRDNSASIRTKIGEQFHIGNGNAKTMLHRLNCLGITYEELEEAVNQ